MQFRISTPITQHASLSYDSRMMLLGSCFAEHIGGRLEDCRFRVAVNPFGICYNPLSIAETLDRLADNRAFAADELVEHNGLWHSMAHHGRFSSADQKTTLDAVNSAYTEAAAALPGVDTLLITFGSSWVYEYQGHVANNCHKIPAQAFVFRRLTVDEIVTTFRTLLTRLRQANPSLKVVYSVSPVRYTTTDAASNATNKAILLLAVEELVHSDADASYFPAYEIVTDELRDYRFYASDMRHPSETAIDYVWQRFSESYFDEATLRTIPLVESVVKSLKHRSLHGDSAEFARFRQRRAEQIAQIEKQFPHITFANMNE